MARSAAVPPSLLPPRRVFVTVASLLAATALVQAGWLEVVVGSIVDVAVQHIISLILAFAALVAGLVWFVWQSGHAAAARFGLLGGLAAIVLAGLATLRIERVSGDLVPQFAWRWTPPRDRLLQESAAAGAAERAAEAWEATPDDYPRFLGPLQMPSLDGPAIDPELSTRPPRELWRRSIGAGWGGFATFGDHAVTLEQRGDEEIVASYELASGKPEWTVAVPARHETVLGGVGPRSTPSIDDGMVYTTGATGWLHAIDGANGSVVWKKNLLETLGIDAAAHAAAVAWGRAGSPLVAGSLVIVPGGGPRGKDGEDPPVALVAFERETGDIAWVAEGSQIGYASPTLVDMGGRSVVMVVNEAEVAGYDPANGSRLWRFDWVGHSNSDANCSQAVLLEPDGEAARRVFVSKGYGMGAAVFRVAPVNSSPWPVEAVWHQPAALKTKFGNVVLHRGHAYGLSDGILECVRLTDGGRAWKGGRYGQGQVLRVGNVLLVQAESGDVAAVDCDPARFRERGRFAALAGQTWNNPCLAGRRLLVRNAEEAACYELAAEEKP